MSVNWPWERYSRRSGSDAKTNTMSVKSNKAVTPVSTNKEDDKEASPSLGNNKDASPVDTEATVNSDDDTIHHHKRGEIKLGHLSIWYRRRQERERYFTQAIDLSHINTNMSTTVAGNKLAQEIHDEFLTCKICLESFKSPKSLDCLHTFCEGCIETHVISECSYKKYSDYREFTCPLCRKRTQLPLGGVKKLPDNFLVSSLGEVVARQKPSKFPFCDICKLVNRKHREATSKCLDCNKLLCKSCVDLHRDTKVTKDHSLFDCEIEKDIECKEHQDEVVRFYCEPCETCICVLCTFNEHKDHEITQFSEAVSKYKQDIQTLLNACKTKTDVYDTQLDVLAKCESIIKAAEQRIHDVAIQFIADIRTREKQLVDELHGKYGPEVMEYVNRKEEMQNNLDSLKSTCNLTELVLKGKDIELLLLKKQVQDKLSTLASVTMTDLPKTVGKQVTFVPGSMELGELLDPEAAAAAALQSHHQQRRGLQSQMSLPAGSAGGAANGIHIRTSETQTDLLTQNRSRMVSRYIQTLPEQPGEEQGEEEGGGGGSWGRNIRHTVATGTDTYSTEEKAVNTRSRRLRASQSQSQDCGCDTAASNSTSTGTGTSAATSTNSTSNNRDDCCTNGETMSPVADPSSSPATARRARRRRERQRAPVEVSVRPTTTYAPSNNNNSSWKNDCSSVTVQNPGGYGPVLTYSSSIEENHVTATAALPPSSSDCNSVSSEPRALSPPSFTCRRFRRERTPSPEPHF